jgi:hypothetical protein
VKRILVFFVVLFSIAGFASSQSNNYANGNGTIIGIRNIGNNEWTFRKHIQRVQIGSRIITGGFMHNADIDIFERPELTENALIGKLKFGDYINIEQIAEVTIGDNYYVWLNINTDNNIVGWIFLGDYEYRYAEFSVPYFNNRWEITKYININNRILTTRSMNNQLVSIWDNIVDIYDVPCLSDSNIILRITPPENGPPLIIFEVMEATEETEIIDGINDRWLRVNYNGTEGWVFGGYTDVLRGGEKYYIPETMISSQLGSVR